MSSLSRRACYKCGNVGHYAEVCSSTERLCYNCKQPGKEGVWKRTRAWTDRCVKAMKATTAPAQGRPRVSWTLHTEVTEHRTHYGSSEAMLPLPRTRPCSG